MKKLLKIIILPCLIFIFILIGYVLWLRIFQFHSSPLSREFYSIVAESKQSVLDLREIKSVQWNEITFFPPYGNICDLGINGYNKDLKNCQTSTDDGECYLIFLNNNELVEKIAIDRKKLDLATSEIPWRVPKEKAIFAFVKRGYWPRIVIFENRE